MTEQSKKARTWGMACHLVSLIALVGIPFGHLLGPLVVWLVKKNEFSFMDEQGKEALNFQLSMTIYSFVAGLLVLVLIGVFLLAALIVVDFVLVIIASVKASNGESYRYPLTFRMIK